MKKIENNYLSSTIVIILLIVAISYVTFAKVFNNTDIVNGEWDVHFANVAVDGESDTSEASLSENNHTLTVNAILTKPKDPKLKSVKNVTVDIVNDGNTDAELSCFTVKEGADAEYEVEIPATGGEYIQDNIKMAIIPTSSQEDLTVKAKSGEQINDEDKKKYSITLEWINNIEDESLEITSKTAKFSIQFKYTQN